MAMRLGISCYIFPTVRSQLCLPRPFFRFSVERYPVVTHSLRHSLSTSSRRLRCLTSSRRRKLTVSALSNVEQEADDVGEFLEPRSTGERNGADIQFDAGNTGTSGRTASQGSRGRRSSGRNDPQRSDWMQGWDDGQSAGTRDGDVKYGSREENWAGDYRIRRADTNSNGVHGRPDDGGGRFKRSDSGSDASSSDARRDAFARFLRRDTIQETEKVPSPEWDRDTGFYPNDARTGRTSEKSSSPWLSLSKTLSDMPTQDTGAGGKLSTSPSSPEKLSSPQDKGFGPLPPLSKFFPDSIVNPFSNPPPISNPGGFSFQTEGDKELAATGRKLGEDLWGKTNGPKSSSLAATRFASKSVGSPSVPSKPTIPGRHSKYRTDKQSKANRQQFSASAPVIEDSVVTLPSSHTEESTSGAAVSQVPVLSMDFRQYEEASSSADAEELHRNVFGSSSCSLSEDSGKGESSSPSFPGDMKEQSDNRVLSPRVQPPSLAPRPSSGEGPVIETFPSPVATTLPFEFQYSYSEVPKAVPVRLRNKFSPFGPQTMDRPWTGKAPLKKSKKNLPEFDSFMPPPANKKGVKYVQQPGPFPAGQGPKPAKSREEILGEPLTKEEIAELVQSCIKEQRQLNLGRDGLTHNMLDLIHSHWKRRRCLKIKCKGVPTVDMDNVCFHLEDKTGGVIIQRSGGTIYLYRGRYYNYKDRPQIPLMLWKPLSPFYPKLVKAVPDGMTQQEVTELRQRGRRMEPLKKLNKNGVYLSLVQEVRDGFLFDEIVKLDCKGLNPSDYKKIGAKLKDLVPCVLLSFEKEQILVWKGRNLEETDSKRHPVADGGAESDEDEDADNGSEKSGHESIAKVHGAGTRDDIVFHEIAGGAECYEDSQSGSDVESTHESSVDATDYAQARGNEGQFGVSSEVLIMEVPSYQVNPQNEGIQEKMLSSVAEPSLKDTLLRKADQLADHEVPPPSYPESRSGPEVLVAEESLHHSFTGNREKQQGTILSNAGSKPEEATSVGQKQRERMRRPQLDDLWNQAIESGEAVALDQPESVDPDFLKEKVQTLISLERQQKSADASVPDADDNPEGQRKAKSEFTGTRPRVLPVDELAKFLSPNRSLY